MADALKFMIEMVDRMTSPATRASLAVKHLDSNLIALKRTVGELAAMPEIKIKVPKLVGAGGVKSLVGPKVSGQPAPLSSRGFEQSEKQRVALAVKLAATIDKAKRQEEAALARAGAAHERAMKKQIAVAKRGQAEVEKAQKIAQRNVEKNAKAAQKAADLQKKAFEKTPVGAFEKAFAGASDAASGLEVFGAGLGTLVNPVTIATTAVLALAAALAGLGVLFLRGAELAIAAAEAKNDTLDMLEAMLGTQEAATQVFAELNDMTRDLAVSQEQVSMSAQELAAAGVTNRDMLMDSVKAIAQVDSVLKGGGAKVQAIIEKAAQSGKFSVNAKQLASTGVQVKALYAEISRQTGVGVKEVEQQLKDGKISAEVGIAALTKVIDTKFGALASKQAMDFGAQMQRLKDNFGKLFEDVNTGPFLDGFAKIVALFDKSTVTGAALSHILTTVFDGLFAAAGKVLPYVSTLLRGLVLITLKVWNAFRPVGAALAQAFGGDKAKQAGTFSGMMILVANSIGFVANQLAALLQNKFVIDSIVASFQLAWFVTKAFVGAIGAVVLGLGALVALGVAVTTMMTGFASKAIEVGTNIVTGLITGMKNGAGVLMEGVRNLAQSALNTFKSTFGIASDSKEMMKLGGHLTGGLATGIDNGAKAANDNMANVVSIESARARVQEGVRPMASNGGGGSTSITIQLGENAVVINGANLTMEEVREQFPEMFADAVELMLLGQGGGASVGRTGT